MVKLVTEENAYWEEAPEKNEAGTPNIMGAAALASALRQIKAIGMEAIGAHENVLLNHLIDGLKAIDGIRIYGCQDGDACTRLGVVSFNIKGIHHALAAAVLAYGNFIRNYRLEKKTGAYFPDNWKYNFDDLYRIGDEKTS